MVLVVKVKKKKAYSTGFHFLCNKKAKIGTSDRFCPDADLTHHFKKNTSCCKQWRA